MLTTTGERDKIKHVAEVSGSKRTDMTQCRLNNFLRKSKKSIDKAVKT